MDGCPLTTIQLVLIQSDVFPLCQQCFFEQKSNFLEAVFSSGIQGLVWVPSFQGSSLGAVAWVTR